MTTFADTSHITCLAKSILSRLLSCCDGVTLAASACVCRGWREATDDAVWRSSCKLSFPGLSCCAPLPPGTTYRGLLVAARRAASENSLFPLDYYTLAAEVWWKPSGETGAAACVFAASWKADVLFPTSYENSTPPQRRSNIVALPCPLDTAARDALVRVTTEWCSRARVKGRRAALSRALTARVLARRADGATAVVFFTTNLKKAKKLSPSAGSSGSSFRLSWHHLDTPLFYARDHLFSDVSATLELEFDGAAQCVGRFSIDKDVGCAKMWRDDLRMALQCVVPWARCQVPQRHALRALNMAAASLALLCPTMTTPHSASLAAVMSFPSVISRVLSFTDCSALAACACVCRAWRAAAADDALWGFAAACAFPGLIASALPIGVTHKNALAAATRAVAIAARPHVEFVPVLTPNLRVVDDFTFAIDVWWTPSAHLIGGANVAAEEEKKEKDAAAPLCVFAASFPARNLVALHATGHFGVTLQCGLDSDGESAAVCSLRHAVRLSHPDTRIGQELSVRITALRSDGAVAVAFTDMDLEEVISLDDDEEEILHFYDEGRLVGCSWCCESPLFFVQQHPRRVELMGSLSLTFADAPVVASFSVGALSMGPQVDLLWALEHTLPWVG